MDDHILNVIHQPAVADDPRHADDFAVRAGADAVERISQRGLDRGLRGYSPTDQLAKPDVFFGSGDFFAQDDLVHIPPRRVFSGGAGRDARAYGLLRPVMLP